MQERTRLRLGTLLWFTLFGATIAITYHQELVAQRIGALVDHQHELRSESERLSANSAALRKRLDELTLDERIARAVVEERARSMRFESTGDSRWAPPFAAWELELLWSLDRRQAERCADALTRLHLQLRGAAPADIKPAFDAFEAELDAGLTADQRAAIHDWCQHVVQALLPPAQPVLPPEGKRKPGGDDAGL